MAQRIAYLRIRHHDDANVFDDLTVTQDSESATTQATVATSLPEYDFNWVATNPIVTGYGNSISFAFTSNIPPVLMASSDFTIELGTQVDTSFNNYTYDGVDGVANYTFSDNGIGSPTSEDLSFNFVRDTSAFTLSTSSEFTGTATWNPTCIVEGEPILMADGSTKLVQDIQVGDELAALTIGGLGLEENAWQTWSSTEFTSSATSATVTSFKTGTYASYINFNNGQLKVTGEHPILIERAGTYSFVQANGVQVDDKFYRNNEWVAITSTQIVQESGNTYSIGCEDADNYYANGVIVHNIEDIIKE